MSGRTIYDVSPTGNGDWKVQRRGSSRAAKIFSNKQRAINYAQKTAKNNKPSQIVIRGQDGQIQREYTYGEDPERYPG
jgi:hypothetical protein